MGYEYNDAQTTADEGDYYDSPTSKTTTATTTTKTTTYTTTKQAALITTAPRTTAKV